MNNQISNKNQLNDSTFYEKTKDLIDEEFLQQTYKIYLGREPDAIGKSTWLRQLRTKNTIHFELYNVKIHALQNYLLQQLLQEYHCVLQYI